jgi:hypothetical protein
VAADAGARLGPCHAHAAFLHAAAASERTWRAADYSHGVAGAMRWHTAARASAVHAERTATASTAAYERGDASARTGCGQTAACGSGRTAGDHIAGSGRGRTTQGAPAAAVVAVGAHGAAVAAVVAAGKPWAAAGARAVGTWTRRCRACDARGAVERGAD